MEYVAAIQRPVGLANGSSARAEPEAVAHETLVPMHTAIKDAVECRAR